MPAPKKLVFRDENETLVSVRAGRDLLGSGRQLRGICDTGSYRVLVNALGEQRTEQLVGTIEEIRSSRLDEKNTRVKG